MRQSNFYYCYYYYCYVEVDEFEQFASRMSFSHAFWGVYEVHIILCCYN